MPRNTRNTKRKKQSEQCTELNSTIANVNTNHSSTKMQKRKHNCTLLEAKASKKDKPKLKSLVKVVENTEKVQSEPVIFEEEGEYVQMEVSDGAAYEFASEEEEDQPDERYQGSESESDDEAEI